MERALEAVVFNVQRFSVHDGPGIRTTVFFKGCPLQCRWCQNPESLRPDPELAFFRDRCRGARLCVPACPTDALRSGPERLHRELCEVCGDCVPVCPYGALEVVGRRVGLDELVAEVVRDLPFFRSSGGGVTLSGGEATLQLEFVVAFAGRLREAGVGVALQTCGVFRWDSIAPHLPLFELVHYDLKVMDRNAHKELTGGDNRVILENARRLVEAQAPVVFRMPLVPGLTDTPANLEQVASFLGELGVGSLTLLPYHAMGEIKSERLGWPLPALGLDTRVLSDDDWSRAAAALDRHGVAAMRAEDA